MQIDIITILPDLLKSPFEQSILKRAVAKGVVEINIINLRDYSSDKHKSVDDYQYGGGAGMVMMVEPVWNCINALKQKKTYDEVIYLSPDGELLTQPVANSLSLKKICCCFADIIKEWTSAFANTLLPAKFLLAIMY